MAEMIKRSEGPAQAAILCGGLGTRLMPLTKDLPKPMVSADGRPFLAHLLDQLKENGIQKAVLMTGYLGEHIQSHFGDGEGYGIQLEYSHGPKDWDTGRRLWEARELLDEEFMLLYGDNFASFRMDRMLDFHQRGGRPLSLTVHPKAPGNILLSADGTVEIYDKNRGTGGADLVELGYMLTGQRVFDAYGEDKDISFSEILRRLVAERQVGGFLIEDAYHSISDPERLALTERYLRPKKELLIDRDGVINKKAARGCYVESWDDFEFLEDNIEAMQKLAKDGFRFSVITNQAGIGRGVMSLESVENIHKRMIQALADRGIRIDAVYMCPHHWEDDCKCRKPKPGLLFKAARERLLRLDRTFYIGDDPRDCQAAYNAGCEALYLGSSSDLEELDLQVRTGLVFPGLLQALPTLRDHDHFKDAL